MELESGVSDEIDRVPDRRGLPGLSLILRAIAGSTPVGIYVIDDLRDRILYFNERFCEIWGIEALAERMRHGGIGARAVLEAGTGRVRGDRIEFDDGRTIRRTITEIRNAQNGYFGRLYLFEDVTDAARRDAALARDNCLLEAVSRVQTRFIREAKPQQVFDAVLEEALALSGSAFGFVGRAGLDGDDKPHLEMQAINDLAWDDETRRRFRDDRGSAPEFRSLAALSSHVVTTRQPLVTNDPANDLRYGGPPTGHAPLRSFLGLPILSGDELVGVIGLANRPGGYDQAMVEYLGPFVTTCATLLTSQENLQDRRGLEEQLLQSQRMEGLGRLAGGVAHDFNNFLTAMFGYLDVVESQLDPKLPVVDDLKQVRAAADRAARLTKQLLSFARRQSAAPRQTDLNALVVGLEKMLRPIVGETVDLRVLLADTVWPVRVDPGQLEQVVVNLACNARDALPKGGQIAIITRNELITVADERALHVLDPGEYVIVEVRDDGVGMEPETLKRAFDPFFTTKEVGRGTGLGLSMCYGMVKQAGGHIELSSVPGAGTTATVYLPRATGPFDVAVTKVPVTAGRGETILLVEDDALVRGVAARALRLNTYVVLEACDGRDALAVARAHTGRIDLLFTDVVMPHVSGSALAAMLQGERPQVRVLYASGYTEDSTLLREFQSGAVDLLQKPYSQASMLRRVRAALDPEIRAINRTAPFATDDSD